MGINNLHSGCVHSLLIARHASKSDNEVTKLFQPMFASLYMMVQNQDILSANLNIDIHNIYVLYMHTYKNIFILQLHQSPYWLLCQHSYSKSLRLSNRFPEKRLTIYSVTVEQAPNVMSVVCNEVFFFPSLTHNCRLLMVPHGSHDRSASGEILFECSTVQSILNLLPLITNPVNWKLNTGERLTGFRKY